jgi:hypothetical protein
MAITALTPPLDIAWRRLLVHPPPKPFSRRVKRELSTFDGVLTFWLRLRSGETTFVPGSGWLTMYAT